MHNRWYSLLISALLLIAMAFSGCTGDEGEQPIEERNPDLDFTEFDSAVEAFLAENQLEGATAIIVAMPYHFGKTEAFEQICVSEGAGW